MMTLAEWTKQIVDELAAAGFEASEHEGFPLVRKPASHEDTKRLLEFETTLGARRRIYAEGMLFLPLTSSGRSPRI